MAENDGAGAHREVAQREQSGGELNQSLTARSNLTFHSTDFITYIDRIEPSAVYSFSPYSFTVHALA